MLKPKEKHRLGKMLKGRKSAQKLAHYCQQIGEVKALEKIHHFLGKNPSEALVQRTKRAFKKSESDWRLLAQDASEASRRVARLFLLKGPYSQEWAPLLQKGWEDNLAETRLDALRFLPEGPDRLRFYNHLIRLLRKDPQKSVRLAIEERLKKSFADLYTPYSQELPPISRLLLLSIQKEKNYQAEEEAAKILHEGKPVLAFCAAHYLSKWGGLKHHFENPEKDSFLLLEKAAQKGFVAYLESSPVAQKNQEWAYLLALAAKREDLAKKFSSQKFQTATSPRPFSQLIRIEETLEQICRCSADEAAEVIKKLPLDNPLFKKNVEVFLNHHTHLAQAAYRLAEHGNWEDWSEHSLRAFSANSPELRCAAAHCHRRLAKEQAIIPLETLLHDPIAQVRQDVAKILMAYADKQGHPSLNSYLKFHQNDPAREAVLQGIRQVKGEGLGYFLLENTADLSLSDLQEILKNGLAPAPLEFLIKNRQNINLLSQVMQQSTPRMGDALIQIYPHLDDEARKAIIPWIKASGWPKEALAKQQVEKKSEIQNIRKSLEILGDKNRHYLFKDTLNGTEKKSAVLAARFIKKGR